ncbi:MAG: HypC/HybG/HupF family hydrogenase formation chaperone [Phycisphaerales bacterium]|nr:MAG: HypC/HybG/HupF family hydrogenase formation chaperone [Phycisphaerales bacterium]
MCLAVPGKIVEESESGALVDFQGNRMDVSTVLTPEAGVGDWVLVHAGFAIAKIDEAAAKETWSYLDQMKNPDPADESDNAETSDG